MDIFSISIAYLSEVVFSHFFVARSISFTFASYLIDFVVQFCCVSYVCTQLHMYACLRREVQVKGFFFISLGQTLIEISETI